MNSFGPICGYTFSKWRPRLKGNYKNNRKITTTNTIQNHIQNTISGRRPCLWGPQYGLIVGGKRGAGGGRIPSEACKHGYIHSSFENTNIDLS